MADFNVQQNILNERFFKDMDAQLVEQMRVEMHRDKEVEALAEASGLSDTALLEELVSAGVTTETMSAFRLVPLVAVAWSDGNLHPNEREAVLKAASAKGITDDSASYGLLASWLDEKMPDSLLDAWKEYAAALIQNISGAAQATLNSEIVGGAEQIAIAAGGFLGLGSISASEAGVITDLKNVFLA